MPHAPVWKVQGKEMVRVDGRLLQHFVIADDNAIWVALVNHDETDDGLKHARLIAAAPAMLEALQHAQNSLDVLAEDAEEAGYTARALAAAEQAMSIRAIITRATGRTEGVDR